MLSCYENHNILLGKVENVLKGKKKQKTCCQLTLNDMHSMESTEMKTKKKKHKKANKPPPELRRMKINPILFCYLFLELTDLVTEGLEDR